MQILPLPVYVYLWLYKLKKKKKQIKTPKKLPGFSLEDILNYNYYEQPLDKRKPHQMTGLP